MNTKEKILRAAISRFNEDGVANVRLQHIADQVGISVGNLAYHFKNKEAIVSSAYEWVEGELKDILAMFRHQPYLQDLEIQLFHFHKFIHAYPFYFTDVVEIQRNYPQLHASRLLHAQHILMQIRRRFQYNVRRGVLKPESFPGQYDVVSHNIWMAIVLWRSQNHLNVENICNFEFFKASIWAHITPYFTSKGQEEYLPLAMAN